jgi:enterochelin esterase-like enzyme
MVAIFIANGGGDGGGSERGLEYDTVSGKYAEFVEAEVLPLVEQNAKVKLTKDPDGRCTYGGSSGAAAAFTMAWFHPELYHRVISYSGTFVNQHPDADYPHGAWEYHSGVIAKAEKKPIRVWLEAGSRDNGSTTNEAGFHNWTLANNRMAEVLKQKGYDYQYIFAVDAGHVDGKVVAQTTPEALEWVWKGYKAK